MRSRRLILSTMLAVLISLLGVTPSGAGGGCLLIPATISPSHVSAGQSFSLTLAFRADDVDPALYAKSEYLPIATFSADDPAFSQTMTLSKVDADGLRHFTATFRVPSDLHGNRTYRAIITGECMNRWSQDIGPQIVIADGSTQAGCSISSVQALDTATAFGETVRTRVTVNHVGAITAPTTSLRILDDTAISESSTLVSDANGTAVYEVRMPIRTNLHYSHASFVRAEVANGCTSSGSIEYEGAYGIASALVTVKGLLNQRCPSLGARVSSLNEWGDPIRGTLTCVTGPGGVAIWQVTAAEPTPAATSSATVAPSPSPSSAPPSAGRTPATTITCIKEKLTKRITGVKPTCPKGYTRKR